MEKARIIAWTVISSGGYWILADAATTVASIGCQAAKNAGLSKDPQCRGPNLEGKPLPHLRFFSRLYAVF